MAGRSVMHSVFLTEPWRPFLLNRNLFSPSSPWLPRCLNPGVRVRVRVRGFHGRVEERLRSLKCSEMESPSSSSSSSHEHDDEQGPPQEAVLKAISVSKTEGRIGQTTNVVIGGTVTDDSSNEWLALDQKVNSYPTVRDFTAIGTGGDDFVQSMVVAVESILQEPLPEGIVKQKLSSGGKYVSVNIGPVQVISSEQVQAVYNAMRRDNRMKYFLEPAL